jgi:hypothetical protein
VEALALAFADDEAIESREDLGGDSIRCELGAQFGDVVPRVADL